jgi:hypothetical protein
MTAGAHLVDEHYARRTLAEVAHLHTRMRGVARALPRAWEWAVRLRSAASSVARRMRAIALAWYAVAEDDGARLACADMAETVA